jgi:hypothetical protein
LLRIIKANTDAEGKRLDLIPRVKVIFGVNELKRAVQELDDTTAALDRFTRILLSNRRTVEDTSSKKAVKLAKALLHVRKCTSNLSLAIFKGWKAGCHSQHEARLFPNDRVDTAAEILKQIGKDNHIPILVFQLLFAEGMSQGEIFWLEADFQVFNGDVDDNSNPSTDSQHSGVSQVTFITSETVK